MDNMLKLLCHPKTPAHYIESINVAYEMSEQGQFWLRYNVEVPEPMIKSANEQVPLRTDDLWQTTCFEAFLAIENKPEYIELNFSPSTQWAAYQFKGYRQGRSDLALMTVPVICLDLSNSHLTLYATVMLPPDWQHSVFSIGLSVVAEEPSGIKSYWALDHKKAEPDFHDRSCFTLQLEAAEPT